MTAIAGSRINSTVNDVPGKVVPAMGHAAVIFGLILDGGFQLDSNAVAIAAITSPVTGSADTAVTVGHRTVVFAKKQAVIEFIVGNRCIFHLMAGGAKTKIFAVFCRVPGRRRITTFNSCTGNY